jgi:sugar phosphate isomerase/epimerase
VTNEITYRPGVEGFMAALALAERLTAQSPIVPSHVRIDPSDWDCIDVDGTFKRPAGVQLYFHRSLENVHAFAEAFGATVDEQPHPGENTYWYADGVLDGVPFRAWTLVENEAAEAVAA